MNIFNLANATEIYRGGNHVCRCGCKGTYAKAGSKAFNRRLKAMQQLVASGAAYSGDAGYVNISLPNNKALTAYFD